MSDVTDEVAVTSPRRTLHSCPNPWRPFDRTRPIQLCTTRNSKAHQREILGILNRIVDTNVTSSAEKVTDLIHPLTFNVEGPSIGTLKDDFVSMLFEKAKEEAIYIIVYSKFLRAVIRKIRTLPATIRLSHNYLTLLDDKLPLSEHAILESVMRFYQLYDCLKTRYSNLEPRSLEDSTMRDNLVILIRFMMLLCCQSIIPRSVLDNVKETFERSLSVEDEARPGIIYLAAEMLTEFRHFLNIYLSNRY